MSIPPPDIPYELPQFVNSDKVWIHIVGYIHSESDCEILASGEEGFFRFYVPKSARIVRKFWQHIGVTNVLKLEEGAYESKVGLGPFSLSGTAIGEDTKIEEAESLTTRVLIGVRLEG